MTISDDLKANAVQLSSIATSLNTIADSLGTWPTAADCLAGTPGTVPLYPSEAQYAYWTNRKGYLQRMQSNIPDGSVIFLGDSITEAMAVNDITKYGVNLGIGGQTTRQIINTLPDLTALHRAGCVVVAIGVNDYQTEVANGCTAQQAINNTIYMWEAVLLPWFTGKLVICKILPIDDALLPGTSNSINTAINQGITSLVATRPNTALVDVAATLAPSGQLPADKHIGDGLHLNAAGYSVWKPAIQSALQSLGIN